MFKRIAIVVLLVPCLALAKTSPKNGWQTGTLLEDSRFPRPCKIGTCTELVDGQRLMIETQDRILTAEQPMIRHPHVTVRGPIQYAIDKQTIWIKDEEGRTFELKIVRQELKSGSRAF